MPVTDKVLPDPVREACAWVAGRARAVRVEAGAIKAYAATLADAPPHEQRHRPLRRLAVHGRAVVVGVPLVCDPLADVAEKVT